MAKRGIFAAYHGHLRVELAASQLCQRVGTNRQVATSLPVAMRILTPPARFLLPGIVVESFIAKDGHWASGRIDRIDGILYRKTALKLEDLDIDSTILTRAYSQNGLPLKDLFVVGWGGLRIV